jgi:mono/diheme cytochrome c family protein
MDRAIKLVIVILPVLILIAGCRPPAEQPAPGGAIPTAAVPAAGKTTWTGDYATHIQPIFDASCVQCHGAQRAENDLRLDSYEEVMQGTQHGPVVIPGQPGASALVSVMRGTVDPSIRMPHGGQRANPRELDNIVLWIEAGAPSPTR